MRVILQRVKSAAVRIDDQTVGQIDQGYLLLVGIAPGDTLADLKKVAHKITNLRIFSDADGKMNLSLQQVQGSILSVSQFTLYADLKHGNRPGFSQAGAPDFANRQYQAFNQELVALGNHVETGHFGADMQVSLVNDGPVTLIYDTADWQNSN